jgi:hypothetical protein
VEQALSIHTADTELHLTPTEKSWIAAPYAKEPTPAPAPSCALSRSGFAPSLAVIFAAGKPPSVLSGAKQYSTPPL